MLISLNWLKQYVDIKESIDEIANALTMIGQEVEAIDIQGKDLDNVVVGQIVEFDKHPNSDRLTLLKVNVGEEVLQIICGATNHKLNDKVVVAKIGAVLPGNFKIKKSKIRDVELFGMLCSRTPHLRLRRRRSNPASRWPRRRRPPRLRAQPPPQGPLRPRPAAERS